MSALSADDLELADLLIAAGRDATTVALPSATRPGFDLDAAWRVAAEVARRRMAAGERPAGWKIGFTNRSIWPRYGVHEPIWGRVWQGTLQMLEGPWADVKLAGLVQPRIEPEIVFGFSAAPSAAMSEPDLLATLAWVAHGVEIVHTHYEGWKFGAAADPVADGGLHGRLIVGPRVPVAGWADLGASLAGLSLELRQDGRPVDRGRGSAVLGGPLVALREGLAAMAARTPQWRVQPGDVVTTGTLTDAWPVAPGQTWSTHPDAPRLCGLGLRFLT